MVQGRSKRIFHSVVLIFSLSMNVILLAGYRDAVQVTKNYSYQPPVVPTGVPEKINWKTSWEFFQQTTLTKVLCSYKRNQNCPFVLPSSPPKTIQTNFYQLEVSEHQLDALPNSVSTLQALNNGNIMIAQRNGTFHSFNPITGKSNIIANLAMSLPDLEKTFIQGPLVGVNEALGLGIRDIDVVEKPKETQIFYTYAKVGNNGCLTMNFEVVTLDKIGPNSPGWGKRKTIWNTGKECISINKAHVFGSGGRILRLSEEEFLISLGDLNTVDNRVSKSNWGNVLLVNSKSKSAEIYTRGHRNPAGLIKVEPGNIFEIEQGPQGGDEINLLIKGFDYGWPSSSFGKNYSNGGYEAVENNHEFGRRPLMAFVPSPAFSSIATFVGGSPTYWENATGTPDLLITSLKANSIYRCRIDTDVTTINYCEKIFLRERLRDLVAIKSNGKFMLHVLSDKGSVISIHITGETKI